LPGEPGLPGVSGSVVTIGSNGNWLIDNVDTGVKAAGSPGTNGKDGQSCDAYEDGTEFVIKCGNIEKARWPKALCGTVAYDPKYMACDDGIVGVTIGNQIWMAKNLNIATASSKCYGDIESNCDIYGRLYNWIDATAACSTIGWKLPDDTDWEALITTVGGTEIAGKALKANDDLWTTNTGTNDYGFSALPGGNFLDDIGDIGYWWSATESSGEAHYKRILHDYDAIRNDNNGKKTNLLSVRCIKD